jgi:hypothetical protein
MGYRDDFYVVDNIVGYTGKVKDAPTVYFESESEIGHITQYHELKNNIGRELVFSREGYSGGNTDEGTDKVRLMEWMGTKLIHTSRNEMISVEGMPAEDQSILAQSIWTYLALKSRYPQ